MLFKICVNLTVYSFLYLQMCWKQKHFYQLALVFHRHKRYSTGFMPSDVLSWIYCWFSLASCSFIETFFFFLHVATILLLEAIYILISNSVEKNAFFIHFL